MEKLLCRLGIHRWVEPQDPKWYEAPKTRRECSRCHREEHQSYWYS